ncbi:MAG: tRNA (adenosine(37)-N6)-threonylcarbamoyltransferase complex transferase subunit TsaD [Patescibacteria group bacterium]
MTADTHKHAAGLIPYFLSTSKNEYSVFVQRRSTDAKRNPNVFGLFGGGIEAGETPEQGLHREILEELSIDLDKPEYRAAVAPIGTFDYADSIGKVRAHEYALPVTPDFAKQVKIGEGQYGIFMSETEIRESGEFLEGHRQMILDFLGSIKAPRIILGIETSCDETALSLVRTQGRNVQVLGHELISQIDVHRPYGGVFPVLAKREHGRNLVPLLEKILLNDPALPQVAWTGPSEAILAEIRVILAREAELLALFEAFIERRCASGAATSDSAASNTTRPAIDAIAVTEGPGLEPALWVGVGFAKALALLWNVPIIPINHMEGHVVASLLTTQSHGGLAELAKPPLPALALLISGGHTELVLIQALSSYEIIGKTRDDAVGEAFDKVARILGLPYPGGPQISTLAKTVTSSQYTLPRPMIHSKDLDFSFSGLKTAALYLTKEIEKTHPLTNTDKAEIAYETEQAIAEVLTKKTSRAIEQHNIQSLIIGGGVIANTVLREAFGTLAKHYSIPLFLPTNALATDNAVMIAVAATLKGTSGQRAPVVKGNLSL